VRLWWARRDDSRMVRSVEISGLPYGTESNPPGWDPVGGIVIAYDAGNAVLRAWRLVGDELEPLWRRDDFAHAGHLILYPDTRELVAQDWKDVAALRRPLVRRTLRPGLQALSGSAIARRASLRFGSDQLVVLDLDTGADKARVDIPSPSQAFLFPAPGFGRDVYYQSLTTIARVAVVGPGGGSGAQASQSTPNAKLGQPEIGGPGNGRVEVREWPSASRVTSRSATLDAGARATALRSATLSFVSK
jgi:hypothetical protein